jgi:hypothetical protein
VNVRIATTAEDIAALGLDAVAAAVNAAVEATAPARRESSREIAERWAYEEGAESGYQHPIGPNHNGYHVPYLRAAFDRGVEDGQYQRYLEDHCCWRH